VRKEIDPLTYAYRRALGRRIGVEVAVNTSLNVGGPIVQTPTQALRALKRSKGMDSIVMISYTGEVFLIWHNVIVPPKDAGQRLQTWISAWQAEMVERHWDLPERFGWKYEA
jgi:carbamoyltransferase